MMSLCMHIALSSLCLICFRTASSFGRPDIHNAQISAVELLISRVLPGREKEFNIKIEDSRSGLDSFTLQTTKGNILQITATSGVAAAWGLNHYLKYYCKAHVSWSGRQLKIPAILPEVANATKVTSPNRYRYYQNVCTSSYSFVWWNWTRWEQEIDWMALNGINLPLAFTGQEAIWRRVYVTLGVSQAQLDKHFAGPAFLAWGRMGNMRGWGGPLPNPTWYEDQLALQHKILTRMRSLGMKPVLPGFAGHVPSAIKTLYPDSKIYRLGDWGSFNSTYCCTFFLDPNDSLFQKIGKLFIAEQVKEFNGTDHIYNADSFNEMTPPSSKPEYLSAASRSVLSAMQAADPEAVWLMQGWLFRERGFWKPAQTKALLTGVPIGKMIVLDLFAEVDPIWKETESFYGQPFIWCMLHNFGGNLGMYGKVESIINGPIESHASKNSTIQGTGIAPEGINQNEFIYDMMAEMGWRRKTFDPIQWSMAYSERRYGSKNEYAEKAWGILVRTIYNSSGGNADHGIPVLRPSLTLKYGVWYKFSDLVSAWGNLLAASEVLRDSDTFRYDLVDVGRQALQDLSFQFYTDFVQAYRDKNKEKIDLQGNRFLSLLEDLDQLVSSDKHFLLGNWLENAKNLGKSWYERDLYEFNARNQITLWGPNGNIHDYANKMWGGLMISYYVPRWRLFISEAKAAVLAGKEIDMDKFRESLLSFERSWNLETKVYPIVEIGDSVSISHSLYQKYGKDIASYSVISERKIPFGRRQSALSYMENRT